MNTVIHACGGISPYLAAALHSDVMDLDADSHVGALCVDLVKQAHKLIVLCDERDIKQSIAEQVATQCNVWLFG